MKEIRQIVEKGQKYLKEGKNMVLATVVHIEGSSYREPGARMLISEDGEITGAVSGGCLEGDILRKALMVMQNQQPLLLTYDTSDEENDVITVNLGCNGIIRVLLEPIRREDSFNAFQLLAMGQQQRQASVMVTFFALEGRKSEKQGTRILFNPKGSFYDPATLPADFDMLEADIQQVWRQGKSAFIQLPIKRTGDIAYQAFLEFVAPVSRIVIAGAGNDALPMVELGKILGWEIMLLDGRPAYATENRFPDCKLMVGKPAEAIRGIDIDEQTAFVLMSHNYDYDKAALVALLGSAVRYIGLLGPFKKRERMLKELEDEGIFLREDDLNKLYAPTGLNIGAEGPEEIALSVMSEIKAVFSGKTGAPLRSLSGHIHRRESRIKPSASAYGVVMLAAGESKRMGVPKQTLPYKNTTLIRHAIHQATGLQTAATVVVIAIDDEALKNHIQDLNVDIVLNQEYKEGMAGSIRMGVRFFREHYPHVSHILFMLCDQPYVDTAHLSRLLETQRNSGAAIVASLYEGRKGVPALFHRNLYDDLLALQGDTGAKYLIEKLAHEVQTVPFPLAAIDVDTQDARERLK